MLALLICSKGQSLISSATTDHAHSVSATELASASTVAEAVVENIQEVKRYLTKATRPNREYISLSGRASFFNNVPEMTSAAILPWDSNFVLQEVEEVVVVIHIASHKHISFCGLHTRCMNRDTYPGQLNIQAVAAAAAAACDTSGVLVGVQF